MSKKEKRVKQNETVSADRTPKTEEIEPFSRCEGVRLIPDAQEKGAAVCGT